MDEYSASFTIGRLLDKYSEQELIDLMCNVDRLSFEGRKIKTIGTFYFRFNNGGTEKVISLLIPIWVSLGYKVVLFTDEVKSEKDYELCDGVERVVFQNTVAKTKEENYEKRAKELEEKLLENSVDVLIYHAWTSEILIWDMLLVRLLKIPFLVYTHGVFAALYTNRSTVMERFPEIYRLCDGILSLTEISQKFYRMYGANSLLVCNPVDDKLTKVKRSRLSGKNILWIGRISGEKKPLDAIKIFDEILREVPDALLHIVGEGHDFEKMRNLCNQCHIEKSVHFCGYQKDPGIYYENADVMLMTSEFEGYSMTLLESKAYGVPCVMYELPYLPLVQDGLGIYAVKQGDIKEAARSVIELLDNVELKKQKGEDAYRSFENVYEYDLKNTWKNILDGLETKRERVNGSSFDKMIPQLIIRQKNLDCDRQVNAIKQSREYKIGKILMDPLRKMKEFIKGS